MKYLTKLFIGVLVGCVFFGAFLGWLTVRAFDDIHHRSMTEINFRASCDAVTGQSVWNGRNWECMK